MQKCIFSLKNSANFPDEDLHELSQNVEGSRSIYCLQGEVENLSILNRLYFDSFAYFWLSQGFILKTCDLICEI